MFCGGREVVSRLEAICLFFRFGFGVVVERVFFGVDRWEYVEYFFALGYGVFEGVVYSFGETVAVGGFVGIGCVRYG